MSHLASNPIRRAVTVVLALSVSMCCCQAHLLFDGLSDSETTAPCGTAINADAPTCCRTAGTRSTDPTTPPEEQSDPNDGCKDCCIKGSGLELQIITVLPLQMTAVAIETPLTLSPCFDYAATRRVGDSTHPTGPPQTLLRMHCALIV